MPIVTLLENPFEPKEWTTHEPDALLPFLVERFGVFPETARIYRGSVDVQHDVTPATNAEVDALEKMEGPFWVVVYPEGPLAIPLLIAVLVAATVAYAVAASVHPPSSANQTQPSPNNELAERQNSARPYGRIPDIFGTVRSTPDLIALPYTVFESNVEVEYAYMSVGRGYFQVLDMRDDTTPLRTINGARASVYDPFRSPNSSGPYLAPAGSLATPDGITFSVGGGAASTLYTVRRLTSVNGQTLYAPDDSAGEVSSLHTSAGNGIRPNNTGGGYCFTASGYSFAAILALLNPGDAIVFSGTFYDGDHINYNFSGIYDWDDGGTNSSTRLAIIVPIDMLTVWDNASSAFGSTHGCTISNHPASSVTVPTTALVPDADTTQVWVNVVANNGAYQQDSGGIATALTIGFTLTCQPADSDGNPSGTAQTSSFNLVGLTSKEGVGLTHKVTLTTPGPTLVTLERTSNSPSSPNVADVCQWRDLYGVTPVSQESFGDITTVQTVTRATAGALSVKERKLNMLVQRLIYPRDGSTSVLSTTLAPSNDVADVLCNVAVDTFIGRRSITEVDVPQIYATSAAIAEYFGTTDASEFCYTFSDSNQSYEETVALIAAAVFSTAYRQGAMMRLTFEKVQASSVMLFNHRNKVPKSEQRVATFGLVNDFDSVQFNYVSPTDESQVTLWVPSQGVNPKKIDSVGVRNFSQAYYLAWRAWNRLKYGNLTTEFVALEEAQLLLMADRIAVADNTRGGTQDGYVVAQDGLQLQLSQEVVFASGKSYHIFLQGIDEAVDSIPISAGISSMHVLLSTAPAVTLALGENIAADCVYWIVANDDARPQAFLVTQREPGDSKYRQKVTAVVYDDRYYANDTETPV